MNIMLKPGNYVAAVSGGVDSMVLLDLLHKRAGVKITVAHLDHGIRTDSKEDRLLVQQTASNYGVPFVYHQLKLGPKASEAVARDERYRFLRRVKDATDSKSIVTAHHLDDLLETALLNMLRGTGRKGLSSLKSTDGIQRPLLSYPKDRLVDYAYSNKLNWHEDSTNQDIRYRRNYIRHKILSRLDLGQRAQLKILLEQIAELNDKIDNILINLLHAQPTTTTLDRNWFTGLPHKVSKEVLHHWLTKQGVKNITAKRVEKLVAAVKTGQTGKQYDADKNHKLHLTKNSVQLKQHNVSE